MRISGLSSGIDYAAIIDQIVSARRQPIEALRRRQDSLSLQRQVYADLNVQLRTLQNRLFNLRLQETFESKNVTSGDPTRVTATAQVSTPVGSHLLQISQLARPARAPSQYARAWLVPNPANTAGVSAASGRPDDNLQGVYEITVTDATAYHFTGAVAEDAAGNSPPTIATGFTNSGSDKMRITVNGVSQDVLVTSWAAGDELAAVAAQLEADINAAFGQTVIQVTGTSLPGPSNDRLSIVDALTGRSNTVAIDFPASSSLGGGPALTALGFADASGAAPHPDSTSAPGSNAAAAAEFSLPDARTMPFLRAAQSLESASAEGAVATSLTGAETLVLTTADGTQVSVVLPTTTAGQTPLNYLAYEIERRLNEALNQLKNTTGKAYLGVAVETTPGPGNDKIAIFDAASVGGGQVSLDYAASTGEDALGFTQGSDAAGRSATFRRAVADLTQEGVASTLDGLLIRLNDPTTGLLPGVTFTAQASGLQAGSARVATDPTLRPGIASPARVYGGASASGGGGIDLYVRGLQLAGFDNPVSTRTNGVFSINGARITISDYSNLTVADLLGLINRSNGRVTATYDAASDRFLLTANQPGPGAITLGSTYDTSDFLTVAKLTALEGAQQVVGAGAGAADPDAPLSEAGLGISPTSGTFTINGITLRVDVGADSLTELAEMISASGAGVTAWYDRQADTFVLASDPQASGSNENPIQLGAPQDTSNILEALNLIGPVVSGAQGQALAGARTAQTVSIQSRTYGTRLVSLRAVSADGAYQTQPARVGLIDIAPGATFNVTTNSGAVQWSNNSGQTIRDLDTWLREWNDPSNWNSGAEPIVRVKGVSEGPGLIRYFAADGGNGTTFSISAAAGAEADDPLEVGMPQAPGEITVAGASPTTEYNALNFAWDLQDYALTSAETGVRVFTDGSGALAVTTTVPGVNGGFSLADSSGAAITEFFGRNPVTAGPAASQVGEAGQDALFSLDGVAYARRTNVVDDAAAGLTLTLLGVTETPVSLDVQTEAEPALRALARGVSVWNAVVDRLSPDLLTDEERRYLPPLSEEDRRAMTAAEVDDYDAKYRDYNTREMVRADAGLQRLYQQLRALLVSAIPDLPINTLATLGLSTITTTGPAGKGKLVADTTDEEALYQRLSANTTLLSNLTGRAHDVYLFFAQARYDGSGASVAGAPVVNPVSGLAIPAGGGNLIFRVGDGDATSGQVSLAGGATYTQGQILSLLDRAGLNIGVNDEHSDRVDVIAAFSLSGALTLMLRGDAGPGQQIYLYDESQGTNTLSSVLGFDISDATPGLSRTLDTSLDAFTSVTGVLPRYYLPGGPVDRQWRQLQTQIDRMEDRVTREETLLYQRFTEMEKAIAQMQWQSQFLSAQVAQLSGQTSSNRTQG